MSWERFTKYYLELNELDFAIDISRIDFDDDFLAGMESRMQESYKAMSELEAGAIANPDEGRMVGHYWLRNAALAPQAELSSEIESCLTQIKQIAAAAHSGNITGATGKFKNCLVIGIGGSALGPQFVADALGCPKNDKMQLFFFDNTDPDGIDRTLAALDGQLGETLAVVISKSGGTPETRNGMLEAQTAVWASSIPLRVSGVPPDLEMTTASVSPSCPSSAASVRSIPSGSVLSKKNSCILSFLGHPSASATNCGPRAEPPMPMTRQFLNLPVAPVMLPLCAAAAICLI